MQEDKKIQVLVVTHKEYLMPEEKMYLPIYVGPNKDRISDVTVRDDRGENIADKNSQYSELTALYWAWKNLYCDYVGIVHYRRYMSSGRCRNLNEILSENEALKYLGKKDVLVVKPRKYFESVKMHFINCHKTMREESARQLEILGEVIKAKEPEYYQYFEEVINGHSAHMFNMFIMKKSDLNNYCAWMFPILFEAEKRIDDENILYERLMGSLSEFLLDTWLNKNNKSLENMNLYQTEMDFFKRVKRFIYRRFFEN